VASISVSAGFVLPVVLGLLNLSEGMSSMAKGVPLNPSSFSEDSSLLDLSPTDVVSLFLDKEKHRHRDARDDESQQEDVIGYRSAPTGLLMALDGNARRLGATRAMLTRCLSHQVVAWVDSLDRIGTVTKLYNIACDAAEEYGYPDLYDKMAPSYTFVNSTPRQVTFRTIRWVKNKLYALSQPIGIPAGAIFIVGLCYSLTRAGSESNGTVRKYLFDEVQHFTRCIDERSVWVCGFNDLVRRRALEDGLDTSITQ